MRPVSRRRCARPPPGPRARGRAGARRAAASTTITNETARCVACTRQSTEMKPNREHGPGARRDLVASRLIPTHARVCHSHTPQLPHTAVMHQTRRCVPCRMRVLNGEHLCPCPFHAEARAVPPLRGARRRACAPPPLRASRWRCCGRRSVSIPFAPPQSYSSSLSAVSPLAPAAAASPLAACAIRSPSCCNAILNQ